jgi:E3 ubiquitin-protein ligase DOA10
MDGEGGEAECRVCRDTDDTAPLMTPCLCDGSIALVHADCLHDWLVRSNHTRCEVCGYTFEMEPVYKPGSPETLNKWHVARLVLLVAAKKVPAALRIICQAGCCYCFVL